MNDPQSQSQDEAVQATLKEDIQSQDANESDPRDKQILELKDQLLRAIAETENTRRRGQKEREDTAKYAVSNFAKETLAVADNFSRALDAAPKNVSDPALKNLMMGIEATSRQLQATLERFGIKKIEPLGQPFDPNFHRVMMEVDNTEKPAGTVVQVMQAGYLIHDRLLREALVAVAKGSPQTNSKVSASA